MHFTTTALTAFVSLAASQSIRGFNTGSTELDGSVKTQQNFEAEFRNQQNLRGLNGSFTSVRLYTMIQGGTTNDPISAIPAAIATDTTLLLGLWASAGQESFDNEIAALRNAVDQYGEDFTNRVVGISVGSEDLYRTSETGVENEAGVGVGPDVLVDYISQLRDAISDNALGDKPVGHVDTWNAWINGTNKAVADACDWVGIDEYPYYQKEDANAIENAGTLFYQAYDATASATGKPIWVTEAGWPVSGPDVNQAVASTENARSFWVQVYCTLPANVPVFWYTQRDANSANAASFGITGDTLSTDPLYNLNCPPRQSSSSSSAAPMQTSSSDRSVETSSAEATPSSTSNSAEESSNITSSVPPTVTSTVVEDPETTPTGTSPTESAPTATPSEEAEDDDNAASHMGVNALGLLIIPALLALMA